LQDTTTPVKISIYAVLLSTAFGKTSMRPLKHNILAPATLLVAGFHPGLRGAAPGKVACDGGLRLMVHPEEAEFLKEVVRQRLVRRSGEGRCRWSAG
jgi:hypothetical protein